MRPLRVRSLLLLLAVVLSLALTYGCAKAKSDTSIPSAEGGVSAGVDALGDLRVTAESNAGLRPASSSALPTAGGLPSVVGLA